VLPAKKWFKNPEKDRNRIFPQEPRQDAFGNPAEIRPYRKLVLESSVQPPEGIARIGRISAKSK
jgi:hypothetical protein